MKKTLLEIVQEILSALDSEDVNSISDTVEAQQVAQLVESTFYDIVATREIPEHESLAKLTSLSSTSTPTHFRLQDDEHRLKTLWYDVSDDGTYEYREIKWLDPEEFLSKIDGRSGNYTLVDDQVAGTKLRIGNDTAPRYYTSFDDEYIVLDSHDSTVDTTLTEAKTRALMTTYPTFSISDSYTPDIDASMFPYLIREATSRCFSVFKGGPDQKIEQSARRQKVHVQNDKRRTQQASKKRNYGRS